MKLSIFGVIIIMFSLIFGNPPHYEKLANQITIKTAKKLKQEKNLCLVGTGGGMMDDIKMMMMGFDFFHEVDLNTSRELLVYTIDKYLSEINDNKEIRQYLHEYPFTEKNIEIKIWIREPDGTYPPADKIHYISASNGILSYYLDLPETHSRKAICVETYTDALKIIQSH